ncbi:MAG: low molecular weight protein arginine phosphatase [Candidatus Hydrothermarchaeaceae archaeon]
MQTDNLGNMSKVLFVCTGNICRSPMAEGLLKKMHGDFSVSSAGVSALYNRGASPEALKVMQEYGVDISSHISRQIDGDMVDDADLVLTMERHQEEFLKRMDPEAEGKIFNLKDYAGTYGDIEDPYGESIEFYQGVAREIDGALKMAKFDGLK